MQHFPLISVIIVTWNSKQYLPACLDKLSSQIFRDFEVILVDNGSEDAGILDLREIRPKFNLYIERLETNLGFAVANNIGARLARGKWIALLNTDAFPDPDWLEQLLLAAEQNMEYTAFSSRQIQYNASHLLDGTGDSYHVCGMAWRNEMGYPAKNHGQKAKEIFSPCAAAAMYLREAFLEVGGFDENFFSYYEDVDLGFRLRLAGYRSLYVPKAVVHHVGSATFGVRSDFAFYHYHRNMIWTYTANMPSPYFGVYLPQHILANLIYVIYYALLGRGKVLVKAKWDALRELPRVWKRRKEIQAKRKVMPDAVVEFMEKGLLQPYRLGYRLRRVLKKYGEGAEK